MKWLYNRLYKKQKGFTLVELMVVIIILAVLTGIAIPSYLALRNRAREQATRSEMQNIATAISVYEADHEEFPTGVDIGDLEDALEADDLSGTGAYMANVPTKDAWNDDYSYTSADGSSYTLSSNGGTGAAAITITDGAFTGE
jgi:general secretion pathway protein G